MDSIKVLIAAAVVVLSSSVLGGCSSANISEVGVQRIQEAHEMKKTVRLNLVEVEGNHDINLQLTLDNPEKKEITSVQAWLSYNPKLLQGASIDVSNSDFDLMAPYNNDFDSESGLLMLGRSSSVSTSEEKLLVAELKFDRIEKGVAMFEAYDYQPDLQSGHTSVNMMFDEVPLNILLKPEAPLLALE